VIGRFCGCEGGSVGKSAASDKAYQLLAHDWWFSPGTLASSTTKTGRHDIAEILLKVALHTINQIKSNQIYHSISPLYNSFTLQLIDCLSHHNMHATYKNRPDISIVFCIHLR
jgi:hypothetical protein